MLKLFWSLLVLACIGLGFYATSVLLEEEPAVLSVSVNYDLHFDRHRIYPTTLREGWKTPDKWGIWLQATSGKLKFPLDVVPSDTLLMLANGRVRTSQDAKPSPVRFRINDRDIGGWTPETGSETLHRLFAIPKAAMKAMPDGLMHVEVQTADGTQLGLESLLFRAADEIANYKGSVDSCAAGRIAGWAVGDDAAAPVRITTGGSQLAGTVTISRRPDLAKAKMPGDAGFIFVPKTPLAPGTLVEINFPNDKRVSGSPCTVK